MIPTPNEEDLDGLEIDLLLEAAYRHYGYDFRDYTEPTVRRRIGALVGSSSSPSALIPRILHDEDVFLQLVSQLSVTVTELFRDPLFYRGLRDLVVPSLGTYPFFNVWHAGCATGEEAYSMAILLDEAEMLARGRIYGTDMNLASIEHAGRGIFKLDTMKQGHANYVASGGRAAFTDYYHARYNAARISDRLSQNMTFFAHNLVSDRAFERMNLIVCRNVLIYFNQQLKDRVVEMFLDALVHRGFLCLGPSENLQMSSLADRFDVVSEEHRIYRKR